MNGYIRLWRSLADSPVWLNSSPQCQSVLIVLLLHACFKPVKWDVRGEQITLQPGQLFLSWNRIMKWCGQRATRQGVRSALARLEKMDFITQETTHSGTLITIVNWGRYQGSEDSEQPNEQPSNNPRTTQQQPTEQPSIKKESTLKRRKEGKKVRNIYSEISTFAGSNDELKTALTDWADMRKKLRKPLTERALNLNLKKLHEMTNGNERMMIEIVNQSVMNSWQGFFPVKKQAAFTSKMEETAKMFEEINRRRGIDDSEPEDFNAADFPF